MSKDTQFQGFAKLLFDKLYDQFNNLHYQEDDGEEAGAEQTKKGILDTIAEGGYDLVEHTIDQITVDIRELFSDRELLERIPDLTELPKEQDYGNGNSVVHPVPPIEVWNALVALVEKSVSTHPYKDIAMNVLSEMRKYTGYSYAVGFKTHVDIERLAIAIQRFVEKQEG